MQNEPDMIDAIEGLRMKLNQEYHSFRQAAIHASAYEADVVAAEQLILRAEETRRRVFETMRGLQPELPAPTPRPLHSVPGAYRDTHQWDPLETEDLAMPSILREAV